MNSTYNIAAATIVAATAAFAETDTYDKYGRTPLAPGSTLSAS